MLYAGRMAWRDRIGGLVRAARKEAGLTQEALAERAGIQPLSVSHFENGRQAPKTETLERIAEATGKPLPWFFQEDGGTAQAGGRAVRLGGHAVAGPGDAVGTAAHEGRVAPSRGSRRGGASRLGGSRASPEDLPGSAGPGSAPDGEHVGAGGPRGAPAETGSGAGGVDAATLVALVQQAVTAAVAPLHAKLDAQDAKLSQQGAELHRLRREVRDKNRADNKLNDAKYRSDWPGRSQDAPSPEDAKAKGA